MRNLIKTFSIIVIVAVIGLSMAACKNEEDPTSVTYTSYDDSGNVYTLEIIKNANRAVYTPQSGDTYILTITSPIGDVIGTSTGTVKTVTSTGASNVLTLEKDGAEFSVSINDDALVSINEAIPMDNGEKITPPNTLIPMGTTSSADFKYEINEDEKTVTITKYKGAGGSVGIPSQLDGKTVTSIGEAAFFGCTSLTSVTIPGSVTSIKTQAFEKCTSLTSVIIGNSVTSILYSAFEECIGLTKITIPSSVTLIENRAFWNCFNLTSVTFEIGSDITFDNFKSDAFPPHGDTYIESLKNAYSAAYPKSGTYTRESGGLEWTKN